MKKILLPALAVLTTVSASAAIKVNWPSNPTATLEVVEKPIGQGDAVAQTTMPVGGEYVTTSTGPCQVTISLGDQRVATVYSAAPTENITIDVPEDGVAILSGTPLMDGITQFRLQTTPLENQVGEIQMLAQTDPALAQQKYDDLVAAYQKVFTDYLEGDLSSATATYALLNLEGQQFLDYYSRLTPEAQNSILMPLVERQKAGVEKKLAAEKRTLELQSGTVEAPAFTLLDLNDKPVSLKDFRGKWVVLDFWGAWCRWCIKGFPELKEAYKDAAGKFEVIGIDNRDTPERWKEAVAKYELPWVNVYNPDSPEGLALLENYAVQGFPTKVIIDPQGIIRHVTVGEDPSFFTVLRELIK
ncbi:MAG: TlpA family protein disulfide reductase [Bacteroidales bacterium]|nr:TlpA family protein disulfide reductase [Bacteroidales bacterium]